MRRGFTLFEAILAVALLAMMMGSVFSYFGGLSDARRAAADHADRDLACSLLIDRLEADLLTCLVGDPEIGAGVKGDEDSIRVLSRSVAANLAERGRLDSLAFRDLQLTEYRRAGNVLEARRQAIGLRSPSQSFQPIGTVAKLRFRYFDGSRWNESFDSLAANGLPIAVEVAIWFHPWPQELDESMQGDAIGREEDLAADESVIDGPALDLDAELRFFGVTPPPDRIRVIAIPDAEGADDSESVEIGERTENEP